jgi:hypothetical protein
MAVQEGIPEAHVRVYSEPLAFCLDGSDEDECFAIPSLSREDRDASIS